MSLSPPRCHYKYPSWLRLIGQTRPDGRLHILWSVWRLLSPPRCNTGEQQPAGSSWFAGMKRYEYPKDSLHSSAVTRFGPGSLDRPVSQHGNNILSAWRHCAAAPQARLDRPNLDPHLPHWVPTAFPAAYRSLLGFSGKCPRFCKIFTLKPYIDHTEWIITNLVGW